MIEENVSSFFQTFIIVKWSFVIENGNLAQRNNNNLK